MSTYNQAYHDEIQKTAERSAKITVDILQNLFSPKSVIDIGCGRGTWLAEWRKQGVNTVLGVDGGKQEPDLLLIPSEQFVEHDLNTPFHTDRRFDLATCLEVAEHLKPSSANTIVQTLTNLSDIIVFGAAVPRQGGFKHINEQWPAYWGSLFEQNGYVFTDSIRWHLMVHNSVSWWYRQNMFIAIKKELYELKYKSLPVYSPEFFVMHNSVYKNYSSLPQRIYFTIEQFVYNNFHALYTALAPTAKKVLNK